LGPYFFGTSLLSLLSLLQVCFSGCDYDSAVREQQFAGAFYPADSTQLVETIHGFLREAKNLVVTKPHIILVPHAGYPYSGATAAYAFLPLLDSGYERVVLIGSSHKSVFDHVAVDNHISYRTSFGDVAVDLVFANQLASLDQRIRMDGETHALEHSLEVQIPFLQAVLPKFSIVPILLSRDDGTLGSLLAEKLATIIDDKTLVLISTDLSHYPSPDTAVRVDTELLGSILALDSQRFGTLSANLTEEGVDTRACGANAVRVGILLAEKLGFTDVRLLSYSHSGMYGGDPEKVVGYGAVSFSAPEEFTFSLSPEEMAEALSIARRTLETYLTDGSVPDILVSSLGLQKPLGAFVTLKKKTGELRGCIGQFISDQPVARVIQNRAIAAAVSDSRFSPVTSDELSNLSVEISILSPMRKIDSPDEIVMGKHGVLLQKGGKGGTYLPQVAEGFGYDKEAFMNSLAEEKAGIEKNSWKDGTAEIYVYEAFVFGE
jgi:AmmeMemoRadiSam system protein B/AmmeMemoRadiSam system protein A